MKLAAKKALENNTPSVRGGLGKFTKNYKAAMRRKVKMASVKYARARQNASNSLRVTRSGRVVKPPRR
jgi:hypothetical protein